MSRLRIVGLSNHPLGPISLTVGSGECVCISGPSGTGKTLLLRAIADLDPHEGEIFLGNTQCTSVDGPQWRRRVGLLLAESEWWQERVGDHFSNAADGLVEQLGFDRRILDRKVMRLSTGERQRLALLRLLSRSPQALLLDEPTASLDAKNVRRAERLIATYRQEHKAPVLWVSHDPRQIKRVGDRHLRLQDGRLK
ncbi:MAG: ATP-binding cassette domain-containing protein [Acidiferrobacterales bacterium]